MFQGRNFGHGFASAGVTQAFAGSIDGIDDGQRFSPKRIVAAAVIGGTSSSITGGKFSSGAVTGAFSRAFNDEAHQEQEHEVPVEEEHWIDTEAIKKALSPANWWSPSNEVVDAVACFGDSLSFNLTKHFRNWKDIGSVNTESTNYSIGNTTGTVVGLANAGRTGLQVYKGVNKAKQWRTNSRTSRATRARRIAAAGSYRSSVGDAVLTLTGGSGVDSYVSLATGNK